MEVYVRSRYNDPNVMRVAIGTRSIGIAPGESKQIFAFGVTRGMVLAIVSRRSDGNRCCTMARYPTRVNDVQIQKLQDELNRHWPDDASIRHQVLIVAEGEPTFTPGDTSTDEAIAKDIDSIEVLTRTIEKKLHGLQSRTSLFIPSGQTDGNATMLALYVPGGANQVVRYGGMVNGEFAI